MENININSLEDLEKWCGEWVETLGSRHIVLLVGEMGVGKTQLMKFVLSHLGNLNVSSPSFAIHNQYMTSKGSVDHVDLYRLEDDDDLESTGFWDLFSKEEGYVFIEWADRLNFDEIPVNWPRTLITISKVSDSKREIRLEVL